MATDTKEFLAEGFRVYTEARNIVKMFEDQLWKSLKQCFDRRTNWLPMKEKPILMKKPEVGGEGDEAWVCAFLDGQSSFRETRIEYGFWWNAPRMASPIVYAGLWQRKQHRVKFNWENKRDGIQSFDFEDGVYLYLPLPESMDFDSRFERLFDAILKRVPNGPK